MPDPMMNIPAFSERVRLALIHAGWTPDRTWDTQIVRLAHEARGLAFHSMAEAFLRVFGGLSIAGRGGGELVTTDPQGTLSSVSDADVRKYQAWVGESLAVIGTASRGRELLLMSARGSLYGGKGEVIIAYGSNLAEIFDRLCNEKATPKSELN
jgi:hypothetical protein